MSSIVRYRTCASAAIALAAAVAATLWAINPASADPGLETNGSLPDSNLTGETATEPIGGGLELEGDIASRTAGTAIPAFSDTFELASETLEGATDPITETAGPVVESTAETVAPAIEPVAETAEPVAEPSKESVSPAVASVMEPAAETLAPVNESIAETTAPVTDTTAPVAEPIADTLAPVTESIAETVAPVTEPIIETIAPATEPITDTLAPVTEPIAESIAPAVPADAEPVRASAISVVQPTMVNLLAVNESGGMGREATSGPGEPASAQLSGASEAQRPSMTNRSSAASSADHSWPNLLDVAMQYSIGNSYRVLADLRVAHAPQQSDGNAAETSSSRAAQSAGAEGTGSSLEFIAAQSSARSGTTAMENFAALAAITLAFLAAWQVLLFLRECLRFKDLTYLLLQPPR